MPEIILFKGHRNVFEHAIFVISVLLNEIIAQICFANVPARYDIQHLKCSDVFHPCWPFENIIRPMKAYARYEVSNATLSLSIAAGTASGFRYKYGLALDSLHQYLARTHTRSH